MQHSENTPSMFIPAFFFIHFIPVCCHSYGEISSEMRQWNKKKKNLHVQSAFAIMLKDPYSVAKLSMESRVYCLGETAS